jgi:hypothetical protein
MHSEMFQKPAEPTRAEIQAILENPYLSKEQKTEMLRTIVPKREGHYFK